jgi:hypothetical protein
LKVYFVRLISNRDLVGIFAARDVDELTDIIDEVTDPWSCEYRVMRPGAIYWTSPAIPVPIDVPEDDEMIGDEDPIPWADVSYSELWYDYFFGDGRWTAIDPEERVRERKRRAAAKKKPARKPKSGEIVSFPKKR